MIGHRITAPVLMLLNLCFPFHSYGRMNSTLLEVYGQSSSLIVPISLPMSISRSSFPRFGNGETVWGSSSPSSPISSLESLGTSGLGCGRPGASTSSIGSCSSTSIPSSAISASRVSVGSISSAMAWAAASYQFLRVPLSGSGLPQVSVWSSLRSTSSSETAPVSMCSEGVSPASLYACSRLSWLRGDRLLSCWLYSPLPTALDLPPPHAYILVRRGRREGRKAARARRTTAYLYLPKKPKPIGVRLLLLLLGSPSPAAALTPKPQPWELAERLKSVNELKKGCVLKKKYLFPLGWAARVSYMSTLVGITYLLPVSVSTPNKCQARLVQFHGVGKAWARIPAGCSVGRWWVVEEWLRHPGQHGYNVPLVHSTAYYSSPMASLVLTDNFKKLPDQITYPYVEPDDLQRHINLLALEAYGFSSAFLMDVQSCYLESSSAPVPSHVFLT
uniref:(California timema) hypothetical protein n=1 Tax=Timema californicum TaxID=61474 RepID=A0A7R9J0X4_TIMCA|nr:unnamed protein product [Timema californicum]